MSEHTRQSQRKDYKNYLGDKIQNEVINLMGENIRSKILELTKKAKYFSILLDCTFDSSHQEQISVCIRFVNLKSTGISIEEHFVLFCFIDDSLGQGLTKFLLSALHKEGLNINDCGFRVMTMGQICMVGIMTYKKNVGIESTSFL